MARKKAKGKRKGKRKPRRKPPPPPPWWWAPLVGAVGFLVDGAIVGTLAGLAAVSSGAVAGTPLPVDVVRTTFILAFIGGAVTHLARRRGLEQKT